MPMIPKSLYHYHEKSRAPFLSISETGTRQFVEIMNEVGRSPIRDNRFDTQEKRDFYHFFRIYTEKKIRSEFIGKGGQPKLKAPRYMTLGPTNWFSDWYEEAEVIEIPLSEFDESYISFTYPDSMMSMLIAENRYEPFAKFKRPYHGKVFMLSELVQLVEEYGFPNEEDAENLEHGNRIIEAQIWDLAVIEDHIWRGKN